HIGDRVVHVPIQNIKDLTARHSIFGTLWDRKCSGTSLASTSTSILYCRGEPLNNCADIDHEGTTKRGTSSFSRILSYMKHLCAINKIIAGLPTVVTKHRSPQNKYSVESVKSVTNRFNPSNDYAFKVRVCRWKRTSRWCWGDQNRGVEPFGGRPHAARHGRTV